MNGKCFMRKYIHPVNITPRHCIISALWVIIGSLTADQFLHERKAEMVVWLIKAEPAVSVCPARCVFEEVLCCGPGGVTYTSISVDTGLTQQQGLKATDLDGSYCLLK